MTSKEIVPFEPTVIDLSEPEFYKFRQNNSGGHFTDDPNLGVYTYIEAHSEEEAFKRAEKLGIYFDGVAKGVDCKCCGDRWKRECKKVDPESVEGVSYDQLVNQTAKNELEELGCVGERATLIYLSERVKTYTCTSIFKTDETTHTL